MKPLIHNCLLLAVSLLIVGNLYAQKVRFTSEELNYIAENPIIHYGYDPLWEPFEFKENGTHTGVTRDFIDRISEISGLKFEPHPDIEGWADAERLFDEGEVVILSCVGATEERKKRMIFTEPYLTYEYVIITQQGANFMGSAKDFEGKTLALASDYSITQLVQREPFEKTIIYKNDLEECMMAVATGEADATAGNLGVVSYFLNYDGYENLKIAAPTGYEEAEFRMGVNKAHPLLRDILDKSLKSLDTKEKNKIINSWVSVTYEYGVDMAKVWRIAGISSSVVLLIVMVIIYWNRKLKKEVVRRKEAEEELQQSFDEISFQKQLIEEQHHEITDSIKYAKRIQEAILPPSRLIKELLPESFVLYKPKDIVAGDFFWLEQVEDKVIFAAADCTGHGVPGAMVSVVCHNALNRAVREFGLTDPGKILDKTRELVIEQFEKSDEEVKDGMDIALCALSGKQLEFAGANNPIWIIRAGTEKIEEIKADKQPIGKYAAEKEFTTHKIDLQADDSFYIFSDGFADQFGGDKGKKFKGASFKRLLLAIQNESMEVQMERINDAFKSWKGDFEQVDDVCVIGVRV